MSKQQIDMG